MKIFAQYIRVGVGVSLWVILNHKLMVFQLCSKNILLTYAQCNLSKQTVLERLRLLCDTVYITVSEELHEDGRPHIHAYLALDTPFRSRNERIFDIGGFHPNIVSNIRAPAKCKDYVQKHGNFVEEGEPPALKRKWDELNDTTSKAEFLSTALEISPRDYYMNLERLQYAANYKFKYSAPEYVHDITLQFNITDDMKTWVEQRMERDRPQSLILVGESRTGKTKWARSLGKHFYFNGYFNLEQLSADVEYAIFDDFEDWTTFKQYKQWLGAQEQFVVTDKYKKKMDFIWGKPCIVLSNEKPLFRDMCWVDINCITVELFNKLY